jgi:NAD(P)-dependent dehydrogenase (short-subunit alcohol dehydrogenase family)
VNVQGKVAIVSGAAGGIGAAVGGRLAAAGACVVFADLDEGRVQTTVGHIVSRFPGRALAFAGDVSAEATIRALIGRAEKKFGPVDSTSGARQRIPTGG